MLSPLNLVAVTCLLLVLADRVLLADQRGLVEIGLPRQRADRSGAGPRIAPVHEPFLTWRKFPLLAIPLSLYFNSTGTFAPWIVFSTACLAVLPLASYMGEATEHRHG